MGGSGMARLGPLGQRMILGCLAVASRLRFQGGVVRLREGRRADVYAGTIEPGTNAHGYGEPWGTASRRCPPVP